jgi:mannose-6-phosphate isomerase-like protein (cupin superfamily)
MQEPFASSPLPDALERAVLANTAYRRVLFTDSAAPIGARTQQVAMTLRDDAETLGWERHAHTAQYFSVVEASEHVFVRLSATNGCREQTTAVRVHAGDRWLVTPGTWHDVEGRCKLYTLYVPPHHPPGTVHATKADADALPPRTIATMLGTR